MEQIDKDVEGNMPDLTNEQLQNVTDPAELRRLVREAQDRARTAAAAGGAEGGGRTGVLLKQDPPSLDECEDYTVWKNKFYVWQAGTAMNDKQQAVCIIQGVMDDHKHQRIR